jgi:hypothetical protein
MAFFPSMPDADMKHTLAREPAIGIPFSQLNEAVMRGDAPFSAGEQELLAAYVSALNGDRQRNVQNPSRWSLRL